MLSSFFRFFEKKNQSQYYISNIIDRIIIVPFMIPIHDVRVHRPKKKKKMYVKRKKKIITFFDNNNSHLGRT